MPMGGERPQKVHRLTLQEQDEAVKARKKL
jgi:hypothetical protein